MIVAFIATFLIVLAFLKVAVVLAARQPLSILTGNLNFRAYIMAGLAGLVASLIAHAVS